MHKYSAEFEEFWKEIKAIYKSFSMSPGEKFDAYGPYKKYSKHYTNKQLLDAAKRNKLFHKMQNGVGVFEPNLKQVCRWLSKEQFLKYIEKENGEDEESSGASGFEPIGF